MRRFFVGFFALIGFATVLLVAGVMLLVGGLRPSVTPLPGNILLTVDLTRDLPEGTSEEPIVRLLVGRKPTLRDFLDAIEAAGNDPRVKVLLARVGDDEMGLARVQEVRDASAAFSS
jgi:protease IV